MSKQQSFDLGNFSRTERYHAFLFARGGLMLHVLIAWQRKIGVRRHKKEFLGGEDAVWKYIRATEQKLLAEAFELCAARTRETGIIPTQKECLRALRRAARDARYSVGRVSVFLVYVVTPLDVVRDKQAEREALKKHKK